MPITFRCPECGGLLSVPKKLQGQTINCPLNGCLIKVGAEGLAERAMPAGRPEAVSAAGTSGLSVRPLPSPIAKANGNGSASIQVPAMAPLKGAIESTDAPLAPVTADWFHRNTAQFITT